MDNTSKVQYLSSPVKVSMADSWFEITATNHFWIKRRFAVLQKLAGDVIKNAKHIAEIGCGHGLVQLEIENAYEREVIGFDLNDEALKRNHSQSAVYCYDICDRTGIFRQKFQLILLFDVLEHIDEESAFLDAVLYHLSSGGHVIVNVPAGRWAYSAYDRAAGHVRRYSARTLGDAAKRNGLAVTRWTYWGFPLTPALALRKYLLRNQTEEKRIITSGFDPGSDTTNYLVGLASKCELIPQKILGTSLMAVLNRAAL
jgi:hypothetical protein